MLFKIAWRDLCRKPIQHILTVLMAGTAVALSIAVMLSAASLEQGMTDAALPFDMIVGAQGSPTQLVFNTIFLQDTPIGNISRELWLELEEDDRVERTIPFAFGDTCQGYRLAGTTSELFTLKPSQSEPSIFQLSAGEFFEYTITAADLRAAEESAGEDESSQTDSDSVGAEEASQNNSDSADAEEAVQPDGNSANAEESSQTDSDSVSAEKAVQTDSNSANAEEAPQTDSDSADAEEAPHAGSNSAGAEAIHVYPAVLGASAARSLGLSVGDTFQSTHGLTNDGSEDTHADMFRVCGVLESMNLPYDTGIFVPIDAIWETHGNEEQDVTALMVTPKEYAGLYQLYQEINNGNEAQAVFPGVVMGEIFESLGQTEDIMRIITWISMAVGLIGMAVSLSWSSLSRSRDNAILRAIGAGRGSILLIVMIEGGILSAASAVFGLAAGHVTALCIAKYMQNTQAFYSPAAFVSGEWGVLLGSVALGLLLSLVPSLRACRTDVVRGLTQP